MFTRPKPQTVPPPPPEASPPAPEPSIRLSELSFPELKALHARLATLIAERETEARQMFKAEFIERMAEYGMTLDDFKPGKKKPAKKRDFPIKYRDPDNPANVWTGIGKPKKWLQEKLDQGHSLDEFLIAGAPAEPAPLS